MSKVSRVLPAPVFRFLRRTWHRIRRDLDFWSLCVDLFNDARRYSRWSHTGRTDREAMQRGYSLLKAYHFVEKGLSFAEPRPGFGQEKIRMLITKISHMRDGDSDNGTMAAAESSLWAYQAYGERHSARVEWVDDWLVSGEVVDQMTGGTKTLRRSEVEAATAGVTPEFFMTRHSIRNFAPGDVPMEDIEAAVRIAQKSPSVCNRQGAKVYCFNNATDALDLQGGNRGFGHLASKGLVVTADLQAFSSIGERHQAYVDGGLFAMSLTYALHSLGYGSCMLAWSVRAAREAAVRRQLRIPENEVIIMMMAVGRLPDELQVPRAWRRPLNEVLVVR